MRVAFRSQYFLWLVPSHFQQVKFQIPMFPLCFPDISYLDGSIYSMLLIKGGAMVHGRDIKYIKMESPPLGMAMGSIKCIWMIACEMSMLYKIETNSRTGLNRFICNSFGLALFIHCGLMTLYSDIDLGQHWLGYGLVAWQHQAITWTNAVLSSARVSRISSHIYN